MYLPEIKNPEQITKDPTLKAIKPWWVVLIGAVILYLVPAQTVLEQPILGPAIDWLASLIPSIARWAELSPFPANTKLFAVFVWVMIPVQCYWLWSSKVAYLAFLARVNVNQVSRSRLGVDFVRILTVLIPLFCLAIFLAIVDSPPCRVCVNTARWAQLFIGSTYSLAIALLSAMCIWQLALIINFDTFKGKNHV